MSKTNRRESREIALQILFQREFLKIEDCQKNLETFLSSFTVPRETMIYAKSLVEGVFSKLSEIDSHINSRSNNWSTKRMPLVDLNILRIAVFELCFSQENVPPKACINEALEIAKKYGGSDSASFINGVLDPMTK